MQRPRHLKNERYAALSKRQPHDQSGRHSVAMHDIRLDLSDKLSKCFYLRWQFRQHLDSKINRRIMHLHSEFLVVRHFFPRPRQRNVDFISQSDEMIHVPPRPSAPFGGFNHV